MGAAHGAADATTPGGGRRGRAGEPGRPSSRFIEPGAAPILIAPLLAPSPARGGSASAGRGAATAPTAEPGA